MNDAQLRKLGQLVNKVQTSQPQMAQATGPMANVDGVQVPQDWEAQVDNHIAQGTQPQALPSWIWALLMQVIQQVINNLANPNPPMATAPAKKP